METTMHAERPDRDQAQESLAQVAVSRRAFALAIRRPVWFHLAVAALYGVLLGLSWAPGQMLVPGFGMVVVVVGLIVTQLERRLFPRRRQELRERTWNLLVWLGYLCGFGVLAVVLFVEPPVSWWSWYPYARGVLAGGVFFAMLRWEDWLYARRVASGAYEPYDVQ